MPHAITKGSLSALSQQNGASLAESFLSAEAILIVDMSGSMGSRDAPGGRSRYQAAEDELRRLQEELPGKVAVVAFSSTVEFVPGGIPPRMGGGTDMAAALRFLLPADNTGVKLVMISDGWPNNAEDTLAVAAQFETQIDCVFIGPESGMEAERGRDFLKRLADATGGKAFKSSQPGLLKGAVEHLMLTG